MSNHRYSLQELRDIAYHGEGLHRLSEILFNEVGYELELSLNHGKEDFIRLILENQ